MNITTIKWSNREEYDLLCLETIFLVPIEKSESIG